MRLRVGRPPPSTLPDRESAALTFYSFGTLLKGAGIVLQKRNLLHAS